MEKAVIQCPACQTALQIHAEYLGREVACPICKNTFRVPESFADTNAQENTQAQNKSAKSRKSRLLFGCLISGGCLFAIIIIIVILAAMLLPALSAARNKARSVHCISNLKYCGLMIAAYQEKNDDFLPQTQASFIAEYESEEPPPFQDFKCKFGDKQYIFLGSGLRGDLLDASHPDAIKNSANVPIMICPNPHANQPASALVLFADGHVDSCNDIDPEDIEKIIRYYSNVMDDEATLNILLRNAKNPILLP